MSFFKFLATHFYLLHIFFIPFHFFPSRTSHWYSAAWQLIPLTWLDRLREPLWQVFQKPSCTRLSPLVSFFYLRNHFSFSSPPDTPSSSTHSPLHLDLQAFLKQLLKTPLTGSVTEGLLYLEPRFTRNMLSSKSLQSSPQVYRARSRPGCHHKHTHTKSTHDWAQGRYSSPTALCQSIPTSEPVVSVMSKIVQAFQHLLPARRFEKHDSPWQRTVIQQINNHLQHWSLDRKNIWQGQTGMTLLLRQHTSDSRELSDIKCPY